MKNIQWTIIILLIAVFCFYGGYTMSEQSGSEPGYFQAVEAAGYGGGDEKIEGVSDEMSDYYQELQSGGE